MKKFERVLLYFLSKKWLSRTEIMKYLYLYEHIHCKHTGKPGTELEFVRWNYGPFEQSVYDSLNSFELEGVIATDTYVNMFGNVAYRYKSKRQPEPLSPVEQDIADYVIYELSRRSFQGMLDLVYSTPPMLRILVMEEQMGEGKLLIGEVLPMNESKGIFKRTRSGREAAIQRLMTKERHRGTDEEYMKVLVEEFKMHESLRRRAQSVAQRFDS